MNNSKSIYSMIYVNQRLNILRIKIQSCYMNLNCKLFLSKAKLALLWKKTNYELAFILKSNSYYKLTKWIWIFHLLSRNEKSNLRTLHEMCQMIHLKTSKQSNTPPNPCSWLGPPHLHESYHNLIYSFPSKIHASTQE